MFNVLLHLIQQLIGWTFCGIYLSNILSYFKFHMIFFLLCITSKNTLVSHESEANLSHAFNLKFILKTNLVLPL